MATIPSVNSFNNPKYQPNNVNAVPKAIPISPSALKDEKEDHRDTVAAQQEVYLTAMVVCSAP